MSTLPLPRRRAPARILSDLPEALQGPGSATAHTLPPLGPQPWPAGPRAGAPGGGTARFRHLCPSRRVGACSLAAMLVGLDLLAITLAATLATWLTGEAAGQGARLGAAFALAWLSAATLAGAYRLAPVASPRGVAGSRIALLAAFVALPLCVAVDLSSGAGPAAAAVMLMSGLMVALGREGARRAGRRLRQEGWHLHRAAVLGASPRDADDLGRRVEGAWGPATRVVARVDLESLGGGGSMEGLSGWLADLVRRRRVDQLVIAEEGLDPRLRQHVCRYLAPLGITCTVIPAPAVAPPQARAVRLVDGRLAVDVVTRPLSEGARLLKRAEDVVIASILLVGLAPVLLLIAAAIRVESRGPVFFRQRRFGFRGEVFEALKFRSMHHDATPRPGFRQTSRHDPRVTRVGRFIRRTSLDELPQLINVLQGSMSIVGPRPHAVEMTVEGSRLDRLLADYTERYRMKPGITGWAQINGLRGEVHSRDKLAARVEHDLFYIANWSIMFDLRIILLSVLVVFRSRHAY